MTISPTDAPAYTDLAGLTALKRGASAKDPGAIREVARQFESLFTRMMLKSMRDAVGPDPMFGSDQQQMYQDMADNQLSIQMAKGKGLVITMNVHDAGAAEDIRVPVFGHLIPFCYRKRRPIDSRFSNENTSATLCEVDTVLSAAEVQQIFQFCDAMGLDYGELDVLRDRDDGRLYVVDVNNTPWGPPNHLDPASVPVALQRLAHAFVAAFMGAGPYTASRRLLYRPPWKS